MKDSIRRKFGILKQTILGSLDGIELDNKNDVIEKGVIVQHLKSELKAILEIEEELKGVEIIYPKRNPFYCEAAANDVGGCKEQCMDCKFPKTTGL